MKTVLGSTRKFEDGDWFWIHKEILKRHLVKIRPMGLAVYNILASMANKEQQCYPSQGYIAQRLGYSRASVSRAIKALSGAGLVSIEWRRGNSSIYRLVSVGCTAGAKEVLHRRKQDASPVDTNNNQRTIINNNKTNFEISSADERSDGSETRRFRTSEEILAYDLAKGLDDLKSIKVYLGYAKRHEEGLLRRILSEVESVPSNRIKKSRTALFRYLLRING